ncbi:lecithin retinol acyltransferase domain-containing protein [Ditylenchus destructor]|nr:lecithin retinol acyltransferase domain-containing protein [Ditylenchus destructor]
MAVNFYLLFLSTLIVCQKTAARETTPHVLESVSAITAKILGPKPTDQIIQEIDKNIAEEYIRAAAEIKVDEEFLREIDDEKKIVPVEEIITGVKKPGQDCKINGKRLSLLTLELFTLTSEQKAKLVGEWFAPNSIEQNKYPLEIGDLVEIKIYLDDNNRIPAQIEEHVLSKMYGNHWVRRNNSLDTIRSPLTNIMERAASKLGCRYKYSLLFFNCELYVNDLRYGMASSMQVRLVFRPLSTSIVKGVAALPVAAQKKKPTKPNEASRITLSKNGANLGS